jgi:hypothetical protein
MSRRDLATSGASRSSCPTGHRERDGQRQLRGEHRQPALLLVDLLGVPRSTRQPDGELGAQPEGAVVQPSTSTGVIGSGDHCANWLSISRRARDTSIRSSLTDAPVRGIGPSTAAQGISGVSPRV